MGLRDRIGAPPAQVVGVCGVKRGAYGLSPQDVKELEEMVDDPSWPAQTLQRRLRQEGIAVSDEAIKKHRARICQCYPPGKVNTDGASGQGRKR